MAALRLFRLGFAGSNWGQVHETVKIWYRGNGRRLRRRMGLLGGGPVGLCRRQRLPQGADRARGLHRPPDPRAGPAPDAAAQHRRRPHVPAAAGHRGRGPGGRDHRAPGAEPRPRPRPSTAWSAIRRLRAFGAALLLDIVALVALFVAGRVVLARIGDPQSIGGNCSASRSSRRCSTGAPSTSCSAPSCGPPRRKAASPRSTMRRRAAS